MKIMLVLHKYGLPLDDPCCYPIGYMYISSMLKQMGHNVKVLNYNLWEYNFLDELKGTNCVFFTGFEEFLPYIQRDAKICKELGIKTVVGGALATFKPKMMSSICDVVITGEGETIISAALTSSGVISGGKINITKLPYPDYEGFGIDEYNMRHKVKYIGILTSRGCPYTCTFCAQTCYSQYRPLTDVFKEIDLYVWKYLIKMIIFNDNTLNLQKDIYYHTFLKLLKTFR